MGIWACLAILAIAAGCAKKAGQAEAEAFFADWLKSHGENDVVHTSEGVGVKGNAVRLKAWIYGSTESANGYSVETEFRILLPSGQEIVEYVAGLGKTEDQAFRDSLVNFMLTTFHPIYGSFINPKDPHQEAEQVLINGKRRELTMGDIYMRGVSENDSKALDTIRAQVREVILGLALSGKPHWIKIVYSQVNRKPMTVAVTLDNIGHQSLTDAVTGLDWPSREEFYMAKQFIVIR